MSNGIYGKPPEYKSKRYVNRKHKGSKVFWEQLEKFKEKKK